MRLPRRGSRSEGGSPPRPHPGCRERRRFFLAASKCAHPRVRATIFIRLTFRAEVRAIVVFVRSATRPLPRHCNGDVCSALADLTWTKLEPAAGVAPPPRWRHTATCISRTQLLIFGGFHSSTTRLNDLWIFDLPSKSWVQPAQSAAAAADAGAAARRVRIRAAPRPAAAHVGDGGVSTGACCVSHQG